MKYLFVLLLTVVFLHCQSVLAQQRGGKKMDDKVQVQSDTIASSVNKETIKIKQEAKEESGELKKALKEDAKQLKPDKEDAKNVKKQSGEILEEKATTNLNYDSDNPENAPWNKQQFSKDDLDKFDSPLQGESSVGNKSEGYKNILNPADKVKLPNTSTSGKQQAKADSIVKVKEGLESKNIEGELLNTRQIYSKKYIQKVYDSLGISKADSLFKLGSALAKTETPKDELLSRINTPLKDQAAKEGVGYDDKSQSLKSGDGDKLMGINDQYSKTDLSKMQLPPDVLSELAPLKGQLLDSKYIKAVDSMRQVLMKAKGYKLDEKQVTEEVKKTSFKKKPSFLDKSYFEMGRRFC